MTKAELIEAFTKSNENLKANIKHVNPDVAESAMFRISMNTQWIHEIRKMDTNLYALDIVHIMQTIL